MDYKRIFRSVLCLLLVCALMISYPARADATIVGGVIAGKTAAGVLGWLFSAAMGYVFIDLTADLIDGIGNDVTSHVTEYYKDDPAVSITVNDFFENLTIAPSSDDLIAIPPEMLAGLYDWLVSSPAGEGVLVENSDYVNSFTNSASFSVTSFGNYVLSSDNEFFVMGFVGNEGTLDDPYVRCLVYAVSDSSIVVDVTGKSNSTQILSYNSTFRCYIAQLVDLSGSFKRTITTSDFPVVDLGIVDSSSNIKNVAREYISDLYLSDGKEVVVPGVLVGDLPGKIKGGTITEEDYAIPYINPFPLSQNPNDVVRALNDVGTALKDETMTYEQYMEQVQAGTVSVPLEGTLANTDAKTFVQSLVNAIVTPITKAISGVVTGILEGIKSLFVPSDGYIDGKINDLRNEYVFADSIASTAKDLRSFLTSLGSKPPVIHIDLGASTGPYDFGGEMVFIDFSFYDPYKPVMDAILSAFLWLWFVWRVILGLPGIISGMSGLTGANIDASSVGVTSGTGAIVTDDSMPKHTPQPGGDAHFREWLRNRNDAHYNEYHGRTKK